MKIILLSILLVATTANAARKPVRHSRGVVSSILNALLPNVWPLSLLNDPKLIDSLERATEDNLCKRSVSITAEPDIHSLLGVNKCLISDDDLILYD